MKLSILTLHTGPDSNRTHRGLVRIGYPLTIAQAEPVRVSKERNRTTTNHTVPGSVCKDTPQSRSGPDLYAA